MLRLTQSRIRATQERAFMAVYRVHFTWKEKEYTLKATSLDMTHPYFVCIKDIVLPEEKSYLINPADDEIRKHFDGVRQLMIPFQSVSMVEEYPIDPDPKQSEVTAPKKIITDRFAKKS